MVELRQSVKALSAAQAADAMRVSPVTVCRLLQTGKLPAVRVGRSHRVSVGRGGGPGQ